jgi:DNA-binding transcriptional LysR family regulator
MVNSRTFDLNLLRVFEALSHDRSVSVAADKLGMTQPAVSNALNRLRAQFDDPLFVRTNKGMQPTPKAQLLAASFHDGLTTIRSGLSAATDFDPQTSTRRFTLLMTDVGEIAFLPSVLGILASEAPGIDINVRQSGVPEYEELLESGIADLAIGRIKLKDAFCSELIHTSPFVVLASKGNRYISRGPDGEPYISLADYLAAPHAMINSRGTSSNPIRHALGADFRRLRLALSLPHTTALPFILRGTDLLATVPQIVGSKVTETGGFVTVPAPIEIEPNFVYQWWHKRNMADPGNAWLRKAFASAGV